jgi:hypothetical protein
MASFEMGFDRLYLGSNLFQRRIYGRKTEN